MPARAKGGVRHIRMPILSAMRKEKVLLPARDSRLANLYPRRLDNLMDIVKDNLFPIPIRRESATRRESAMGKHLDTL